MSATPEQKIDQLDRDETVSCPQGTNPPMATSFRACGAYDPHDVDSVKAQIWNGANSVTQNQQATLIASPSMWTVPFTNVTPTPNGATYTLKVQFFLAGALVNTLPVNIIVATAGTAKCPNCPDPNQTLGWWNTFGSILLYPFRLFGCCRGTRSS